MGEEGKLGIVLTGGGARAAYQVGFLRCLARKMPALTVPVITGVSAGAINAVFLAAHRGGLPAAAEKLTRLWSGLSVDKVFHIHSWFLARTRVPGSRSSAISSTWCSGGMGICT